MKRLIKWLSAFSFLAILVSTMIWPSPVAAAVPTITGVNPQNIVNNVNNAVTIDGSNFTYLTEVSVGSVEVDVTSFSDIQLIVRIPSGFEPGDYSITVTNPGTPPDVAVWSNTLHVAAPTATTTAPTGRPQIVIDQYVCSVSIVRYGQDFKLDVSLDNAGGTTAYGMQVLFSSADLIMLQTGGVKALGNLGIAGKSNFSQMLTASHPFADAGMVSLDMTVSYVDDKGTAFSDKFTLGFPAAKTPT